MKSRVVVMNNKAERFMELEGLRGLAAIIVVVFHAILMFYPGLFYGPESYGGLPIQNMRFEDNLYANPLMGILTGSFSVAIFFVLSGFVLSVGFLKKGDAGIIKRLAAKRYIRLTLPALAAILFSYIIIQSGLGAWKVQAAEITHSSWLAGLWTQAPSLWDALTQSVYGVFVTGSASYNPVLWTMKYELIGSFIIFGVALLFSNSKYRWIVYLILCLVFHSSWYLGFIIGMILADLYVNHKKQLLSIPAWALVIGAIAGVGLGAFPPTNLRGTLFQWIQIPSMTHAQNMSFYLTVAATLVILAVLSLPRLVKFFAHPKIALFGKYTFALYLVHMPILLSLGAGVFVAVFKEVGFHMAVAISMSAAFIVIIPISYLFERYIDAPSIKLSSSIADIYSGKQTFVLDSRRIRGGLLESWMAFKRKTEMLFSYKTIKAKYAALRAPIDEDSE